ncbi:FtsX-like permease family protein [candidate division KSB1 bacterium]|nr:FtsX-like permease family protein [candidate division KSB1 bacterium]RQW04192.1 MAG: FtsX-like permease family protein [candidate division KSB1 bacterium]
MIQFLLKGILRDHSRSLFPLLTVAAGAFLIVLANGWVDGARNDMLWVNAIFSTGHVKVMTNAYAKDIDLVPNDLAILGADSLLENLKASYPNMIWSPRIKFGGLLDIPDAAGETRAQTIVAGLALPLTSGRDVELLGIDDAIVRGRIPAAPNELIISQTLANQLNVSVGDTATLVSSTMYGSLTMHNFVIAATIHFGVLAMDRSTIIANLPDIRVALDMDDAAGEILGFFPDFLYHDERADHMAAAFTAAQEETDEFALQMLPLVEQRGLRSLITMMDSMGGVLMTVFIFAMAIVLWNAGLMGSLRRYGEIGLRLAVGEKKGHVYRSLLAESILVGIGGAILGTIFGLAATYYLQVHGIDISSSMKNTSMMLSNVIRAQITPASFYVGLIPGIVAPLLGTSISGIAIYKRETAQLFKELEV